MPGSPTAMSPDPANSAAVSACFAKGPASDDSSHCHTVQSDTEVSVLLSAFHHPVVTILTPNTLQIVSYRFTVPCRPGCSAANPRVRGKGRLKAVASENTVVGSDSEGNLSSQPQTPKTPSYRCGEGQPLATTVR